MTNDTKYYIRLSLALGFATPKCKALSKLYPQISDFFSGGEREWRLSGVLNDKDISALNSTPVSAAIEIIGRCNRSGISVISIDDPVYPDRLKEICDPPAVLYMKGHMPDFENNLTIAVVGTRKATAYGKMASHVISGSLAKVGVIVVSGGAVGIDSLSHTAALEAGGVTVCVLGCGIDYPYLTANRKMRENITERGAVLSEYPPDYPPGKFTFPARNRILSGLSDGVLVVEAGAKSGSLITARDAAEQGRDVFAVMGNINSPYSQGTNALIKDGAVPVTDFTDITSYYTRYGTEGEPDDIVQEIPQHRDDIDVGEDAEKVYRTLTAEPMHIDDITLKSQLPVSTVLQALTELELEGLAAAEKGGMYKIV